MPLGARARQRPFDFVPFVGARYSPSFSRGPPYLSMHRPIDIYVARCEAISDLFFSFPSRNDRWRCFRDDDGDDGDDDGRSQKHDDDDGNGAGVNDNDDGDGGDHYKDGNDDEDNDDDDDNNDDADDDDDGGDDEW